MPLTEDQAVKARAAAFAIAAQEREAKAAAATAYEAARAQQELAKSYAGQAAAVRDAARAQAELASPVLALLGAQQRVREAQERLTEAQNSGETSADELREAQVGVVEAQGALEVAAANATQNINEGTTSFAELARQAGITDSDIRDIINSLNELPTTVPININFRVTGLDNIPGELNPDLPDVPRLAGGGHMNARETALVGEKGPELWRPDTAGQVIPLGGNTSNTSSSTVQVFVDGGGGDVADQTALGLLMGGITEEIEWAGTSTIR